MSANRPPDPDWVCYDDVADRYDGFLQLNGYAALANDLIDLLNLPSGGSILDVGCGTGAVALAARKVVGARGLIVGLDLSLAMLHRAVDHGLAALVGGTVLSLPFQDGTFDGVAASLVVSHVDAYEGALREMVRVLKPGGWLGVTAGARSQRPTNLAYQLWVETAESFVGPGSLSVAGRSALPREAWFTDGAHVATALAGVGLERVEVQPLEYRVEMATDEYLSMFDVFAYGRFLRGTLGERRWREFGCRVREVVAERCGARVHYVAPYNVGIGRRPT